MHDICITTPTCLHLMYGYCTSRVVLNLIIFESLTITKNTLLIEKSSCKILEACFNLAVQKLYTPVFSVYNFQSTCQNFQRTLGHLLMLRAKILQELFFICLKGIFKGPVTSSSKIINIGTTLMHMKKSMFIRLNKYCNNIIIINVDLMFACHCYI